MLRHVVRAIHARWPRVDILIRGDSHYGRSEGMAWCERNRVGYILGLAGNKVLLRHVTRLAEEVALERLDAPADSKMRRYKLHLVSDRTSCTKATANQFRLLLHTAAYWLMHTLRDLAPKSSFWQQAQFDILRLGLIKVAVRVSELVTKIKIALPTGFAYQHGFATLAAHLAKVAP